MVGYPVGGSVTLPFHASMIRMLVYELEKKTGRLLAKAQHVSSLYVADNRTLLAQQFLETRADWLLQIDTDIEFPKNLLEIMLEHAGTERKILAASVPLGETYETSAFVMDSETDGLWRNITKVPHWPIECDAVATAVLLTHRKVFEGIARAQGQCWFHHFYIPESPIDTPREKFKYRSQGEDMSFCVRAKRCGFKVWCVHVPGLRHFKTKAYSHDFHDTQAQALAGSAMGELVEEG